MRVVVTGGAGFIGRAIVKRLAERGDSVVALVRNPSKSQFLARPTVTLVSSDLSSAAELAVHLRTADAVIHAAGSYRVGIKPSECRQMWDANVGTAERVLDAAILAAIPRILYVSTVGTFGNTRGAVVDEEYQRDLEDGWLSCYDETKYRAHEAAAKRIQGGAPIVIVQPSQVYGPDDHSVTSQQIADAHAGRLRYTALAGTGLGWVHVHDLVQGIVAALDRGQVGQSYVLSGERMRLHEAIAVAARVGGRTPPRLSMPTGLLKLIAPLNDVVGGMPGFPSNLREVIRSGDDVTYWASESKARRDLGFDPRPLEQGIADTWGRGAPAKRQS
jgi:dihydroflavonol-4-reductase